MPVVNLSVVIFGFSIDYNFCFRLLEYRFHLMCIVIVVVIFDLVVLCLYGIIDRVRGAYLC